VAHSSTGAPAIGAPVRVLTEESAGYQRGPSGTTGRTVRPNVEFVTAANDAYQAAAAVARPK
jgi:hypothetical protein